MARLVLGPLLRYVDDHAATVWVETDAPCAVEVLGHATRTFAVAGHHYALVVIGGLRAGETVPYAVHLDGIRAWPLDGEPPSLVRPPAPGAALRLAFGSCRVCAPHEGPEAGSKDDDPCGRGTDALRTLALEMRASDPETWPDALLLLGDQVYADEPSPGVRELTRARRDTAVPPGETVADFEEYTALYREAWSEPVIRWLLATVPTAMIFDDHDVHDDWNTSQAWVETMRAKGWWDERIVGGFASYWLYQHLGNLAPADLAQDELWTTVRESEDASALLREFAFRADRAVEGSRWSFVRDFGRTRLVMVDSRAGRVLAPGRRSLVDAREWAWIEEHATGGVDHLLVGTSLPLLLTRGLHDLEAWNEAVCDGAWGRLGTRLGERVRQGLDLEHWAAFGDSFARMTGLLGDVAAGRRGERPASVVVLSGDVHHCYLAELAGRREPGVVRAPVWQATCSPFRNPLDRRERAIIRLACSPVGAAVGRALARSAGVGDPSVRWRLAHRAPWFDNQVGTLELDGRRAHLVLRHATPAGLAPVYERELAA